jgi:hypothetical protein
VATAGVGESGNFMVLELGGHAEYNEILGGNSSLGGVPSVTINPSNGEVIAISGLSQVVVTAQPARSPISNFFVSVRARSSLPVAPSSSNGPEHDRAPHKHEQHDGGTEAMMNQPGKPQDHNCDNANGEVIAARGQWSTDLLGGHIRRRVAPVATGRTTGWLASGADSPRS